MLFRPNFLDFSLVSNFNLALYVMSKILRFDNFSAICNMVVVLPLPATLSTHTLFSLSTHLITLFCSSERFKTSLFIIFDSNILSFKFSCSSSESFKVLVQVICLSFITFSVLITISLFLIFFIEILSVKVNLNLPVSYKVLTALCKLITS